MKGDPVAVREDGWIGGGAVFDQGASGFARDIAGIGVGRAGDAARAEAQDEFGVGHRGGVVGDEPFGHGAHGGIAEFSLREEAERGPETCGVEKLGGLVTTGHLLDFGERETERPGVIGADDIERYVASRGLEVAAGNDAMSSHSQMRKTAKLMLQMLPGTDFITSGHSVMPRKDNLFGGGGQDVLRAGAGDDTMNGNGGADRIAAGSGDDVIDGGGGRDNIDAGAGDDIVRGGNGADTIEGGAGDDRLTGGNRADVFVFASNSGDDIVADYEDNRDKLQIDGNFSFVDIDIDQDGADAIISFGAATITLLNQDATELTETDFLF